MFGDLALQISRQGQGGVTVCLGMGHHLAGGNRGAGLADTHEQNLIVSQKSRPVRFLIVFKYRGVLGDSLDPHNVFEIVGRDLRHVVRGAGTKEIDSFNVVFAEQLHKWLHKNRLILQHLGQYLGLEPDVVKYRLLHVVLLL